MKNFRNKIFTGALALGLFVGGAGIATAATSTDFQQKMAEWIKNDPNPMVMNMNTSSPLSAATPTATDPSNTTQAPADSTTPTVTTDPSAQTPANSTTPSQKTVQQQTPTQPTPQKPAVSQSTSKPAPSQPSTSTPAPSQSDRYNQMRNNCYNWDQNCWNGNWNGNGMSNNGSGYRW